MNSYFDEGQPVRVARLADVKADYQVSSHTPKGVIVHAIDESFDNAFRRMRIGGAMSSMNVNFRWRVGVKSGGGSVVYDGDSRFPNGTAELARRTIQSMIVRSIARELSMDV